MDKMTWEEIKELSAKSKSDHVQALIAENTKRDAAVRTLEMLGYTHNGGELWAPPIGEHIDLRRDVLALYTPPFKFNKGYLWDSKMHMVADSDVEMAISRVRGWGRISYMENPAALQDAVGAAIAEALNDYWRKHNAV